jgi:hypothetical protein
LNWRRGAGWLLAAGVIWLAGCGSIEAFRAMMDQYLGQPIEEVQRRFGYNHLVHEVPNGGKAYTWAWVERGITPGYQSPATYQTFVSGDRSYFTTVFPGMFFPPQPYELVCELSFVADAGGRVVAWRAHGDNCAYFQGPDAPMWSGRMP